MTITYKDGDDKQIEGVIEMWVFCMPSRDDMERIQENSDCVYIDNYWLGGDESDVYHYVFRQKGECITSELGYIIQDEGIPEDSKYIYYLYRGYRFKTNDKVQKYFKLEL